MNNQINHALLDEYGLNEVNWRLLALVAAAASPLKWKEIKPIAAYYKITGNPAPSLHKLVDRGLLSGPARTEHIMSSPFQATGQGHTILAKIERGLHRPMWLSAARLKVLNILKEGYQAERDLLHQHKCHPRAILSLSDANYIYQPDGTDTWHITALGSEAWAEYQQQNQPEATHA
jgi:hypothetical protein